MVMGVMCDGHFAFRVKRGELGGGSGELGPEWGCVDSWCCYVLKFE
jgi:hypothetical protein